MSEHSRRVGVSAALLTGSMLLSSCSVSISGDTRPDRPKSASEMPAKPPLRKTKTAKGMLPRCYEKPLKNLKDDAFPAPKKVLKLPYDAITNRIAGDPAELKEKVDNKVRGSIVQITRPEKHNDGKPYDVKGSGFILRASGVEYVITAAHVVVPAKRDRLTVTDNQGNSSGVKSGCFIYEDAGVQYEPSLEGSWRILMDIAVLRLEKPLGTHSLSLARKKATRSDWGAFYNYQSGNNVIPGEPGNPATYAGIYGVTKGSDWVITGVQPWREPPYIFKQTGEQLNANQALPGSSGGVVIDPDNAEVQGMSYAGADPDKPLSASDLSKVYGLRFPGIQKAPKGRFLPTPAVLIDISGIKTALNSPKLR